MLTLSKTYEFAAGHRIYGHEGKCANLHGHTYKFKIDIAPKIPGQKLDSLSRLVDYSVLDETVGAWIKEKWDHCFFASSTDPVCDFIKQENGKLYALGTDQPTIEVLAQELYWQAKFLLARDERFKSLRVASVTGWESPTSCAEYRE
jgi:6-pyruvoyltetrahydropterin/6-carboxytetrahydropterin synthase